MGDPRRLIFLVVVAAIAGGCKRDASTKGQPAPPPAPSAVRAPDRLVKGEIAEGREHAFTMPLPLRSTIKVKFADSVHVMSPHSQEELANFTRARVKDGVTTAGANGTRFEGVIVTRDPSRRLTIEIRATPGGDFRSQMVVSDVTPPPGDEKLTPDERWKKAGMTPDGKLINAKQMQ